MLQGLAETDLGLQGVAEGVAEIEQGPLAALALVRGDDLGLHFNTPGNGLQRRLRVQGQYVAIMGPQPFEKIGIAQQAVLDDFGIAAAHFAGGQGGQHVEVAQHQARLPEGADQVLALFVIDRRLAADRAVDLGQQRRRDLDEVDAAHIDGAGKAGQVADDAAAQGQHHVLAVESVFKQGVEHELEAVIGFAFLAGGHDHRVDAVAGRFESHAQRRLVQRCYVAVGDDHNAFVGQERRNPGDSLLQEPLADDNLVGFETVTGDGNAAGHVGHISLSTYCLRASSTRSTVFACEWSPVSTTRSAISNSG